MAANKFLYVGIEDEFYEFDEDEKKLVKEYREWLQDNLTSITKKVLQAKVYDDLSFQVILALNQSLSTVNKADIKNFAEWQQVLDLPFQAYWDVVFPHYVSLSQEQQIQFNKDLDSLVILKTGKYYYNSKLPTENIALLAREHLLTPDGDEFIPKLWQIRFLRHEVEKEYKIVATARQRGKTLMSALIAMMILFKEGNGNILYLIETDKKKTQPKEYMEQVLKKYVKAKLVTVTEEGVKNNVTGNKLYFWSAKAH